MMSTRRIPRRTAALAAAAALGVAGAAPAATASPMDGAGPQRSHTAYHQTGLPGHPAPRTGGVLDLTFDRTRGALERHLLAGGAPSTAYTVVGEIHVASACADVHPVLVPEGSLTTDDEGSGTLVVRFPGEAFAGAPDRFWVRWRLQVDAGTAYRTGCVTVDLATP